jgi:hypothetical protein
LKPPGSALNLGAAGAEPFPAPPKPISQARRFRLARCGISFSLVLSSAVFSRPLSGPLVKVLFLALALGKLDAIAVNTCYAFQNCMGLAKKFPRSRLSIT